MRAVDIIMKKRDGHSLDFSEIEYIVKSCVNGTIPEYQVSAWLMAIFFQGMSPEETAWLTRIMLESGRRMDLAGIDGPFVDKHSTGGVGDKLSLILAPMVAACGVKVPMMSGRALGHTGGTLDKLDSIPGFRTSLDEARFRAILKDDGFAMTGQTADIVPADKILYSLRDVTATVESIPLITASILSKKVAEGAESLVFDVKSGKGAFMKKREDARALALSLVKTGTAMGKKIVGLITDMDEPLGLKTGNFLEVEETLDCLDGKGPDDIMEITYRLGAWMLILGDKAGNLDDALGQCKEVIHNGKAKKLFMQNVRSQGGDPEKLLSMYGNYRSQWSRKLYAEQDGYIHSIDAYSIGQAGVILGVGRNTMADSVSMDAGFIFTGTYGRQVKKGELIVEVFGKSDESISAAWPLISSAISIQDSIPVKRPLIIEEITAE